MPTETFQYTGSEQSWTVPDGVSEVDIELRGGGGGDTSSSEDDTAVGGDGGVLQGALAVSPGETFYIYVGGGGTDAGSDVAYDGAGGWPNGGDGPNVSDSVSAAGGGGGGSSDIRQGGNTTSDRIAVAGGGGGGGAANDPDTGVGNGGDGGGDTGQDGGDASAGLENASGGAGGTQSSGYTGGDGATSAHAGVASGGGGGGGYAADGGGASSASDDSAAGGGGGGANYDAGLTSVDTNQQGGNTGDGQVVISYTVAPNAPNNPSQTVQGDDQIEVDADEDTSAGDPANYRIEVSEDGGSWSLVAEPSAMPYTYEASPSVDEHEFRIRAENSAGVSDWVYTATKSTDITTLSLSNTGGTSFDLSWDAADDATDYDVLLAEASGSVEGDYAVDQTVAGTTATVSGLENGERYYARPIARYPQADSLGEVEQATTTTVPAPVIDSLDASVEREITVHFSLPDNSSDGDVLVEVSTDGGQSWSEAGTVDDVSLSSFTHTGRLDGMQYTYRLTRRTDHAESTSGTATARTILPPPLDLTHPTVGATTADYDWTPQHNNGQTRVEYKPTSDSTWQTYDTVARDVTQATVDELRHGEAYDSRVVAETEHATTEDQ